MRTFPIVLLAALTAATVGVAAPATAAPSGIPNPAHLSSHVVASFDTGAGGSFLESIAADGHGGLVGSLTLWGIYYDDGTTADNVGQVVRVRPGGASTNFGPAITLGPCAMLTGVTVDEHGRVFVGVFNFAFTDPVVCGPNNIPSSVLRVTEHGYTTAMRLPDGAMTNGITTHRGDLYVADSNGSIWKGSTTRRTSPTSPWFSSSLLAPTSESAMGANGIAFFEEALYVTSYSQGLLVRVGIGDSGRARGARVVADDPLLARSDGIAFDRLGRAWITVNPTFDLDAYTQNADDRILVVNRSGRVTVAATPPGTLDYPTQAVIDGRGVVYVANGAYNTGFLGTGVPQVVAFTS